MKNFKKYIAVFAAVLLLASVMYGCSENDENQIRFITENYSEPSKENSDLEVSENITVSKPSKDDASTNLTEKMDLNFKIGFIYLHDSANTYDLNFMTAAKAACAKFGVQYIEKTNIPEGSECKTAAEELTRQGCKIIFANSFGHENFLLEVAEVHPEIQFCHASGIMAHTENLSNFHNAYARSYEGRFLCGIAAGMKCSQRVRLLLKKLN